MKEIAAALEQSPAYSPGPGGPGDKAESHISEEELGVADRASSQSTQPEEVK